MLQAHTPKHTFTSANMKHVHFIMMYEHKESKKKRGREEIDYLSMPIICHIHAGICIEYFYPLCLLFMALANQNQKESH